MIINLPNILIPEKMLDLWLQLLFSLLVFQTFSEYQYSHDGNPIAISLVAWCILFDK